jgi:sugar phosphate isomerase/epimerase
MMIATTLKTYLEETNDDFDKAFAMIKQDGFEACGIVMNDPLDRYLSIKDKLRASGLRFCIHAPITDINISSTNLGIRKESVKQVKDAILLGKEIDAVVTFHPGSFRNTFHVDEAYENMDMSIMDIMNFAKENDVCIFLENMEPGKKQLCTTIVQLKKVTQKFKDLNLCLDIAHAAMITENYMEYWHELKHRIKHIHISGINDQNSHVEVSLNESSVDFTDFIKTVKSFKGIIRIENRTRAKNLESLEFIREALR